VLSSASVSPWLLVPFGFLETVITCLLAATHPEMQAGCKNMQKMSSKDFKRLVIRQRTSSFLNTRLQTFEGHDFVRFFSGLSECHHHINNRKASKNIQVGFGYISKRF